MVATSVATVQAKASRVHIEPSSEIIIYHVKCLLILSCLCLYEKKAYMNREHYKTIHTRCV